MLNNDDSLGVIPGTTLEQFGHIIISILGACNLGAQIKDLYTCVEKKIKVFANYYRFGGYTINSGVFVRSYVIIIAIQFHIKIP